MDGGLLSSTFVVVSLREQRRYKTTLPLTQLFNATRNAAIRSGIGPGALSVQSPSVATLRIMHRGPGCARAAATPHFHAGKLSNSETLANLAARAKSASWIGLFVVATVTNQREQRNSQVEQHVAQRVTRLKQPRGLHHDQRRSAAQVQTRSQRPSLAFTTHPQQFEGGGGFERFLPLAQCRVR